VWLNGGRETEDSCCVVCSSTGSFGRTSGLSCGTGLSRSWSIFWSGARGNCQCHFAFGVNLFNAAVGRICGYTISFCRNCTIGAQYASGFDFQGSHDRSICKRGTRGTLRRSPHKRVVQQLYGAKNALFRHIVCNVPVAASRRGNCIGRLKRPNIVVRSVLLAGTRAEHSINGLLQIKSGLVCFGPPNR
jgi:hypothetical protein